MNLFDKIFRKNKIAYMLEEIAKTYKEQKENGEHPIDTTAEKAIEIIKNTPNEYYAKELLIKLLEKETIPNRVFEKIATEISKSDKLPDKLITKAVIDSNEEVPDKVIDTVIVEGDVNFSETVKLMQTVEDSDILKRRITDELDVIYNNCREKTDIDVVTMVQQLQDVLISKIGEDASKKELKPIVQKIVAKKMAENFYSDSKKGTNLYTLSQIMPIEEMIEDDLPTKVETEYKKTEQIRNEKPGRYNKKRFKMQILSELGKEIASKYNETGALIIPQSEIMKKTDNEERETFVKHIQIYSKRQLTKANLSDIYSQIRGISKNVQAKENMLITAIKKLPDDTKLEDLNLLTKIVENHKSLATISLLEDSNTIAKLNEMTLEQRKQVINSINKVLGKIKLKDAKKSSPEFKRITFSKRDDEGVR